MIIICFSIFSGIDYSESFHLRHLYGGGGAGGVYDHNSQRNKKPFHISRGK